MKCKTCGEMNCMAHGGMADDMDMDHMRSLPKPMKMAKGGEAEELHHSPAGGSANRAKGAARSRNEGRQEGVNRSRSVYTPGESGMGYSVRGGFTEDAKKMAHQTIKESRNVAGGPSKKPLEGLADGGEVEMKMDDDHDMDNELHESLAHELMEAFEKKDKKGVLESIKALVMSCGGKV